VLLAIAAVSPSAQEMPIMPMGMNTGWNMYWSRECAFIDVMKTASAWITYHDGSGWNSGVGDSLEVDENGYPLEIPQTINGNVTRVRFLINNFYEGRYVFLYEGEGEFTWRVPHEFTGGKHYVTLDGTGGNKYIQITSSTRGNHIRNIRILPVDMENSYDPAHPFRQEYLDFLEPFQVIRVRGLMGIDDGYNTTRWHERPTPSYYTQSTWHRGVSIEHCVQLCNELNADMWFSVPHPVWDDWIINAARLVRDSLKPCLKVYLEFSNELWNWGRAYPQSQWVLRNGRWDSHPEWDCADSIHEDLAAINPERADYPEKDAYMMARLFNIWRPIFAQAGRRDRLVCVAGIQDFYIATTKRILRYLFDVDGGGCDAIGPDAYFNLSRTAREAFDGMAEGSVTTQMLYDSAVAALDRRFSGPGSVSWELDSVAKAYGVDVAVYEGGAAMYDYNEHHWSDSLTALQSSPRIYDLYRRSLGYWRDSLNCVTNVMLSSIGEDYSTFAHITDYDQIYLPRDQMMEQAPKYLAITDACALKRGCPVQSTTPHAAVSALPQGACRIVGSVVSVNVPADGELTVTLCSVAGRRVAVAYKRHVTAGETVLARMPVESLSAGVYLVRVKHRSLLWGRYMSIVK